MTGVPLVVGGTGVVGKMLLSQLAGQNAIGMSRAAPGSGNWIAADVGRLSPDDLPPLSVVYATCPIWRLLPAIPAFKARGVTRIVCFTSTSIHTKSDSPSQDERELMRQITEGEANLKKACEEIGISWNILRPTIVYKEGLDENISRIAGLIRRFKFFPIIGKADGLRQPVHAEDLAIAAATIATTDKTRNKAYDLPGCDPISYREMIGRVFDGLNMPRRIVSIPAALWSAAMPVMKLVLPGLDGAMVQRMSKNMTFDASSAKEDFGWNPRPFRPQF